MKTDNNRNSTLIQIHCCKRIIYLMASKVYFLISQGSQQPPVSALDRRHGSSALYGRWDGETAAAQRVGLALLPTLSFFYAYEYYYTTGVFWGRRIVSKKGQNCLQCILQLGRQKSLKSRKSLIFYFHTVFENHRKSRIQHCEQSELRLHFKKWTKVHYKGQKWSLLASF